MAVAHLVDVLKKTVRCVFLYVYAYKYFLQRRHHRYLLHNICIVLWSVKAHVYTLSQEMFKRVQESMIFIMQGDGKREDRRSQ